MNYLRMMGLAAIAGFAAGAVIAATNKNVRNAAEKAQEKVVEVAGDIKNKLSDMKDKAQDKIEDMQQDNEEQQYQPDNSFDDFNSVNGEFYGFNS